MIFAVREISAKLRLAVPLAFARALLVAAIVMVTGAAASAQSGRGYITPFPKGDVYNVVVLGDDLAQGLLGGLLDAMSSERRVKIDKKTLRLNGLNRGNFYRTIEEIERDLDRDRPHIAVVMLGAWDRVSMKGMGQRTPFGSQAWKAEYAKRADRVLKALKDRDIAVYWVGLPIVRRSDRNEDVQMMNQLLRDRIYINGLKYIDAYANFSNESGGYSSYGPDITGKNRRLRDGDGVYFTLAGYRKLAHFVERDLKRDLAQAKNDRSIPLAGSEEEQAKINPQKLARKLAAEAGKGSKKNGDRSPAIPRRTVGAQSKDDSRIVLKNVGRDGNLESVQVDIVRPAIPASVIALVTRKESADRLSQMGEQIVHDLDGGLSVMNSITPAAGGRGDGPRRLSTVQTPYYRVFIKGERLTPVVGRADDFTWPRAKPPVVPKSASTNASQLETASAPPRNPLRKKSER